MREGLVQALERGNGLLEGSDWAFPRSQPEEKLVGAKDGTPAPGSERGPSLHSTPPRPASGMLPPRPHQKPGSVRNPTPPSAAAKPAPARATPRGRPCPQPTSGSRGRRGASPTPCRAPRPRAVPGTKRPAPPRPAAGRTCCASCTDSGSSSALHWLLLDFLLSPPPHATGLGWGST